MFLDILDWHWYIEDADFGIEFRGLSKLDKKFAYVFMNILYDLDLHTFFPYGCADYEKDYKISFLECINDDALIYFWKKANTEKRQKLCEIYYKVCCKKYFDFKVTKNKIDSVGVYTNFMQDVCRRNKSEATKYLLINNLDIKNLDLSNDLIVSKDYITLLFNNLITSIDYTKGMITSITSSELFKKLRQTNAEDLKNFVEKNKLEIFIYCMTSGRFTLEDNTNFNYLLISILYDHFIEKANLYNFNGIKMYINTNIDIFNFIGRV